MKINELLDLVYKNQDMRLDFVDQDNVHYCFWEVLLYYNGSINPYISEPDYDCYIRVYYYRQHNEYAISPILSNKQLIENEYLSRWVFSRERCSTDKEISGVMTIIDGGYELFNIISCRTEDNKIIINIKSERKEVTNGNA